MLFTTYFEGIYIGWKPYIVRLHLLLKFKGGDEVIGVGVWRTISNNNIYVR